MRRPVLEQRAHLVRPGHVCADERDPVPLLRSEQGRDAMVVRARVRGHDVHALVDELPQDPRPDAAEGAGEEKPLAHAAVTGLASGGTPSTVTSTTSPAFIVSGGSRE